ISREEQDEFAFHSHAKYFAAQHSGKFKEEIIPVEINGGKEAFAEDEHPRKTTIEKLASLKPAFSKNGTVTAGNSSGLNDGAAAMLMASEEAIKKYNFKPLARVVCMAVAGVDPSIMGIGP